ncbi:MAG: hypothetical protein PHX82_04865, partial [Paracoccaceae bacterium]|nr:hypothetical protein [Paracoccaceae bacterium]
MSKTYPFAQIHDCLLRKYRSGLTKSFALKAEMLAFFIKLIRIVLFYGLYLFICMLVVVILLQSWLVGEQMIFAFGVPLVLVWAQERRWSKKRRLRAMLDAEREASAVDETTTKRAVSPTGPRRPERAVWADATSGRPEAANRETVPDVPSAPASPVVTAAATLAVSPKPAAQVSTASVSKTAQAFSPATRPGDGSTATASLPAAPSYETRAVPRTSSR